MRLLSLCVLVLAAFALAQAARTYKEGDVIPFYVNTIGPYSNPSELYPYYSLPFCAPPKQERVAKERKFVLGEQLEGDEFRRSLYQLHFQEEEHDKELCRKEFSKKGISVLKRALEQFYYFELLCDDLPVHGFIGHVEDNTYYLFTHIQFNALYNKNQIISVNVSSALHKVVELKPDAEQLTVDFTYSVKWSPTDVPVEQRHYLSSAFFNAEMEIHWLSIMNSFVLVILLTGFLAIIIMRVLKSDYTRYNDEEQDEEDYGWKLIHGDVFRFPPNINLFCACFGAGAQFLCISLGLLMLALIGMFYPGSHGSLYTACVVLYALTSAIAGGVSGNFYRKLGGQKWSWNIVLTACLYGVPFLVIFSFVNTVAAVYGTTTAVSFGAIFIVLLIWLLVGVLGTVLGGIAGRHIGSGEFQAPCRTKNFSREIPATAWYRQAPVQILMAGFLPFSAIYIELYYIYTSVWGHNSYTLYGILSLVFLILIIVTACITVALTYFQLSMEDYRWWWRSFACGGSTGLFIFAYSVFYYFYRTKMHGLLQFTFYFGYMALVCWFFFLMLGSVGFYSSLIFVRNIYKNIHVD